MKRKILALGLLSLCSMALFGQPAQAWFGFCWDPHHRYTTQITCRPYNAFTPICWGNLVCDGCTPSPCGVANGCLPMMMGTPPFPSSCCGQPIAMGGGFGQAPCMGGGCGPGPMMMGGGGSGYASDMPMRGQPMPGPGPGAMPMPMPNGPPPGYQPQPSFTPPMPMPTGPGMTMQYPPAGVAQANYYPNYYPMPMQPYYPMPMDYNPYYQQGWPNTQPMPSYWYGNGR